MPYIDKSFYTDVYMGTPIDDGAFPRLLERAVDSIDHITNFALVYLDLDSMHQVIQLNFKKAVAAQVEYLSSVGESVVHGISGPANVSVGAFSYSEGRNAHSPISPAAVSYLRATGFLNRGVTVRG
ncbi:hypothetical protein M4D56_04035 [Cytobacillus oceanisediminis]|uniref:hypothetical protein n=1 Tax=Cytobacillus oceanisediminis TaxID=665099 RepID=UPI0018650BF9|nr:hypothetical protein [Cytobacillus oceanisediminis]MCM3528274.1 hypothetical protein [Cytobacillus oceanisediminis]QOK27672.1 hypothetical protein IIE26_03110 [Cytobacillus oceanisediminis]